MVKKTLKPQFVRFYEAKIITFLKSCHLCRRSEICIISCRVIVDYINMGHGSDKSCIVINRVVSASLNQQIVTRHELMCNVDRVASHNTIFFFFPKSIIMAGKMGNFLGHMLCNAQHGGWGAVSCLAVNRPHAHQYVCLPI